VNNKMRYISFKWFYLFCLLQIF